MAARKTSKEKPAPSQDMAAHEGQLVERPKKDAVTKRREQEEMLAGIKNRLFADSMQVIGDTLRARDVDVTLQRDLDPAFERMVDDLGEEEAQKAYRVAVAGWNTAADAPVFVKVATNIAVGIMKANAAEKGGPKVLNVGKVMVVADSIPQFEEREVDD